MNNPTLAAQLATIKRGYVEKTKGELASLANLITPPLDVKSLTNLKAGLHKLAGSGGTFGFPQFGAEAKRLELLLVQWLEDNANPNDPVIKRELAAGFITLQNCAPALTSANEENNLAPTLKNEDAVFKIGVDSNDRHLISELTQGLGAFGYEVTPAAAVAEFDALLLDVDGLSPESIINEIIAKFSRAGRLLPIIAISTGGDFQTRFACAKAGADGFVLKPVDVPRLVDQLDQFRQHSQDAPFRILIIDDDELLASHFRLVLENAGMEAFALSDPRQALDVVKSFRPEMILLDLYMPNYPGADLARTIRQDNDWLAVPIVYLSSERNIGAQLAAMEQGGDDFLTKPISDPHLVTAVRIRAERARSLSDLMYRDSMTGLLRHARIKDQLVVECERAKRSNEALCAAMLDIDHFKLVNDNYGHAVGDRVIKALAQLLKQRARKTDILGRYGGEEFAIILPACNIEMAKQVLDDIRQRFNSIIFAYPGGVFSVTLSGGIAQMSEELSDHALLAAADGALYRSKQGGRNRISAA